MASAVHRSDVYLSTDVRERLFLGAMRRTVAGSEQPAHDGESAWTEDDIDQAEGYL